MRSELFVYGRDPKCHRVAPEMFLDMLDGKQENHNPLSLAMDVLKITKGEEMTAE